MIKTETLTTETLESLVGTLGKPGKMPGYSFGSIPASFCKTGSKLAKKEGTVCSKCYALKGRYMFNNVQNALKKRMENINHPLYPYYAAELIKRNDQLGYIRLMDSGDIQSAKHLAQICKIAELLPKKRFWLPSKETKIVSDYIKNHKIPKNLTIRLSGFMIDGPAPKALAKRLGVVTSTVVTDPKKSNCNAWKQGGKCLDCRKCWNSKANVAYLAH